MYLSHKTILFSFKAGQTFSTRCCLLLAAKSKASDLSSNEVFSLSKIIFLICSAILTPPGSRVKIMLYFSFFNFSNTLEATVVFPVPSPP